MLSRPPSLLLLLGLLPAFAGVAPAADPDPVQSAERILHEARQPTDGPALLEYLRRRTLGDAERAKILDLIKHLADDEFAVREKATDDLLSIGIGAAPLLRLAARDPDIEVVRRAERCLKRIEESAGLKLSEPHAWATISLATVRLIGYRKPAGAAEALLGFLPFADDELVADEVRASLAAVALHDGKPEKAVVAALEDRQEPKRAAAVQALIRSSTPEQRKAYHHFLGDSDLAVRHQAALAFFDAKDREAVPALIGLLGDLPAERGGWGIEDTLCRLAGDKAPAVSLGRDDDERKRCRDAWQEWWRKNGDTIDLTKINLTERMLGFTLVVELNQGITGRVKEVGPDGKPRWQIEGLAYPVDAQVVGDDRVVVAEYRSRTVSERNFKGEVIWQKTANTFVQGVQRLPSGNTLVVTRNQIVEVDREGKDVATYTRPTTDIMAAQRRRDGQTVLLNMTGLCVVLDANNQEVKSFPAGTTYVLGSNVEVLGNGRILVPQYGANKVVEFDADGKQVWEATVMQPSSVVRLANGNTVVASNATGRVVEVDRTGKEVWDYKGEGRLMRARRR
jgi:hypothetical protein